MGQHSLGELWTTMPVFAKIIWFALAVMSIWSLSVAIGKWWGLRKAQAETRKFAPEFAQLSVFRRPGLFAGCGPF